MQIKRVGFHNREIKSMYFEAFPKRERMPFPLMVMMSGLWNTQFLAFYEGERPVGMIYLAKNFRMVFIMFFAVEKTLRSKGYGSEMLREIKKRFPRKKIVVSIEPTDDGEEINARRKVFYLRNSFRETGWKMCLGGTEQEILSVGDFKKREFISFLAHYSNGTLWPKIWRKENEVKEWNSSQND